MRLRSVLILFLCLTLLGTLASCSPFYVIRAGWEEAGILLRREKISELVKKETLSPELIHKLQLVLDAREFAEGQGLKPEESFTRYADVNRDVLVWVLTASEKTALKPYTWWFPIVGSVPYKGYFEREDGLYAAASLEQKGYDTALRPSAAFSTLGWFNDPLLSTTVKFEDVTLVNTVIHEILHNTIWIKDNAEFNETLANVVGSVGAEQFFRNREGPNSKNAARAADLFEDELTYGRFLASLKDQLDNLYAQHTSLAERGKGGRSYLSKDEVIKTRDEIYRNAKERWKGIIPELRTPAYSRAAQTLNNASLIGELVYLTKPDLFYDLYKSHNRDLAAFLTEMNEIIRISNEQHEDPFSILAQQLRVRRE